MNSAVYSTNCTIFDPKGKILQVKTYFDLLLSDY